MLVAAAVVGLTAGLILGWIEFVAAGTIALSLLLLASVFLFGARAYEVDLTLAHDRVVAGAEVSGAITVTNIGRRLALPGVVDVPVGEGLVEIASDPAAGEGQHGRAALDKPVGLVAVGRS